MRPDVGYAFSTSELVYSKKFVSGSFKISNCDRSSDRFFFFLVYYSNKPYIMVWRLFKASVY